MCGASTTRPTRWAYAVSYTHLFFWNKGGWIQNRAFTLAIWCMFAQCVPAFQDYSVFSVQSVNNPNVNLVVSVIALVANVAAFAYIMYRARTVSYTHLNAGRVHHGGHPYDGRAHEEARQHVAHHERQPEAPARDGYDRRHREDEGEVGDELRQVCLLYTSPSGPSRA